MSRLSLKSYPIICSLLCDICNENDENIINYCVDILSNIVVHIKLYIPEIDDNDMIVKYFEFLNENEKYMIEKEKKINIINSLKISINSIQYFNKYILLLL